MAYTKNPFLQGMRKKLKNYCPRFFFFFHSLHVLEGPNSGTVQENMNDALLILAGA